MDKRKLYIVTLSSMSLFVIVALSAINESRLDVYVSLIAVSYFVTSSIFRPRRRMPDIVGSALMVAFAYIVATRIIEILA